MSVAQVLVCRANYFPLIRRCVRDTRNCIYMCLFCCFVFVANTTLYSSQHLAHIIDPMLGRKYRSNRLCVCVCVYATNCLSSSGTCIYTHPPTHTLILPCDQTGEPSAHQPAPSKINSAPLYKNWFHPPTPMPSVFTSFILFATSVLIVDCFLRPPPKNWFCATPCRVAGVRRL